MDAINRVLVSFLLNCIWQISLLAVFAVGCSVFMRRVPGRQKHVLWVLCLWACVLVPAVTVLMQSARSETNQINAHGVSQAQLTQSVSRQGGWSFLSFRVRTRPIQFGPQLMNVLAVSYLAVLLISCLRLGWISHCTWQIRKFARVRETPPALARALEACACLFRIPSTVLLCSEEIQSPSTMGWKQPVLLVPPSFFNGEIREEDAISALSHEMAHIRRCDFLLNLLYELVAMPVRFHPGIALIRARIAQTRELACDEMAARLLPSENQYARSLLQLAQSMFAAAPSAKSNYAMGLFDTHALEERIMNILRMPKASSCTRMVITLVLVSTVSILTCAFSFRVSADTVPADAQRFVGTWVTKYKGQTFVTFNLKMVNGRLGGSCVHVDRLDMLEDGELVPTSEQFTEQEIVEAKVLGSKVALHIGGHDSIYAELTLKGANDADVLMVGDPSNKENSADQAPPQKKPWHFQRVDNK